MPFPPAAGAGSEPAPAWRCAMVFCRRAGLAFSPVPPFLGGDAELRPPVGQSILHPLVRAHRPAFLDAGRGCDPVLPFEVLPGYIEALGSDQRKPVALAAVLSHESRIKPFPTEVADDDGGEIRLPGGQLLSGQGAQLLQVVRVSVLGQRDFERGNVLIDPVPANSVSGVRWGRLPSGLPSSATGGRCASSVGPSRIASCAATPCAIR